jgi:hypothetical protein
VEENLRIWLMQGDPAIRWQVLRDLLDAPSEEYETERARVAREGWGAGLLSRQDALGTWAGGLYSPKWTSTTYTLLTLRHFGLTPDHPKAIRGCEVLLAKGIHHDGGINLFKSIDYSETCVNGMLLALFSYFQVNDESVHSVARYLLGEQMPDGGWNCQRILGATHSSFHTTISVLEGLHEYHGRHPSSGLLEEAMLRGHEFLLAHRLYRSHRTGKIVDPSMTRMNFPPRWHYDFIRALDHLRSANAFLDERMQDAIDLLRKKRKEDGRWPAYRPFSGRMFFSMEQVGQPSRWNTLRGLRVLRWWENFSQEKS